MHPFSSWMQQPQRSKKPWSTVKISMVKQNYSSFDSCVQFSRNTWCCELQRMQFPLALQVAIRVEKNGELGTTHFSCPNFSEAKSRSVLSFTLFTCLLLARPCFWNMDIGQLAMEKYQRKHQIGLDLGWDGFKQSEVPTSEKEQKRQAVTDSNWQGTQCRVLILLFSLNFSIKMKAICCSVKV